MKDFHFTIPYDVRVADVNYGGHVANSAVLNFFQDARIAYLDNLGAFSELDLGEGCGIILPEAHVRYLAEMFLGDSLQISVAVRELRNSALVMNYLIEREGTATAEGTTNLVCYDYSARKVRRLPRLFRQALIKFEGLEQ
ncbi:MAG TPA: thioesterase family protein [Desulfuromonadales bacterium]|nr:thioesterase family protein [Desulfuromonadales bacterium]